MLCINNYININNNYYINYLCVNYNLPPLDGGEFATIAQYALRAYGLWPKAHKITIDEICLCVQQYLSTPFGRNALRIVKNV